MKLAIDIALLLITGVAFAGSILRFAYADYSLTETEPPAGYVLLQKDGRFGFRHPSGLCSTKFVTREEALSFAWRVYRTPKKAESEEEKNDRQGIGWAEVK